MQLSRWPVRELLVSYLAVVKEQMIVAHRHSQLLYQVRVVWGGSNEQPPQLPDMLRGDAE